MVNRKASIVNPLCLLALFSSQPICLLVYTFPSTSCKHTTWKSTDLRVLKSLCCFDQRHCNIKNTLHCRVGENYLKKALVLVPSWKREVRNPARAPWGSSTLLFLWVPRRQAKQHHNEEYSHTQTQSRLKHSLNTSLYRSVLSQFAAVHGTN